MNTKETVLAKGNEAVALGAVAAGCRHFFGYPITPQNEVIEWFAKEYPKRGWCFVQAESEYAVAAMMFGASAGGVRVMTSTSGPGWGLMQEILSNIVAAQAPVVIVDVQRGGPGQGTTSHAQMDYTLATRGGHGGWKNIVLAPNSVQENGDLVQLAFHLADKYRYPVVVLTDAIIGQMIEKVAIKTLDFGPLPPKDWAIRARDLKGSPWKTLSSSRGFMIPYRDMLAEYQRLWQTLDQQEVRCETDRVEDAELFLVAYGYPSRVCADVVDRARADGLRVGLIRPITLAPFPYTQLRQFAARRGRFIVVEDSLGQMLEDVRLAVGSEATVELVGVLDRHLPTPEGMIMPDTVFEAVQRSLAGVWR